MPTERDLRVHLRESQRQDEPGPHLADLSTVEATNAQVDPDSHQSQKCTFHTDGRSMGPWHAGRGEALLHGMKQKWVYYVA